MWYNRHHRQVVTGRVSLSWTRTRFSNPAHFRFPNSSLMSASNLLSRIEAVRVRLVPLRDGL